MPPPKKPKLVSDAAGFMLCGVLAGPVCVAAAAEPEKVDREMLRMMELLKEMELLQQMDMLRDLREGENEAGRRPENVPRKSPPAKKKGASQ